MLLAKLGGMLIIRSLIRFSISACRCSQTCTPGMNLVPGSRPPSRAPGRRGGIFVCFFGEAANRFNRSARRQVQSWGEC
jgi:hypothetical protein